MSQSASEARQEAVKCLLRAAELIDRYGLVTLPGAFPGLWCRDIAHRIETEAS